MAGVGVQGSGRQRKLTGFSLGLRPQTLNCSRKHARAEISWTRAPRPAGAAGKLRSAPSSQSSRCERSCVCASRLQIFFRRPSSTSSGLLGKRGLVIPDGRQTTHGTRQTSRDPKQRKSPTKG